MSTHPGPGAHWHEGLTLDAMNAIMPEPRRRPGLFDRGLYAVAALPSQRAQRRTRSSASGPPQSLSMTATPDLSATRSADVETSMDDAMLANCVNRIVHQDEAALALLYRSLCSRVHRLALRLTRDSGAAEEVVEDVFWQVWRQAPRFDPARGPVVAWVLQIARSRAVDAWRAAGRDPLHAALDIDDELAWHEAGEDLDPQALLSSAQVGQQIDAALGALDPLRRQLVSLAFHRGYSQSEIAEQTGLPLGTVKSHLRRALAMMKQTLQTNDKPAKVAP
jgi:RNA polymerase sigma factor (sigma-70 family)